MGRTTTPTYRTEYTIQAMDEAVILGRELARELLDHGNETDDVELLRQAVTVGLLVRALRDAIEMIDSTGIGTPPRRWPPRLTDFDDDRR